MGLWQDGDGREGEGEGVGGHQGTRTGLLPPHSSLGSAGGEDSGGLAPFSLGDRGAWGGEGLPGGYEQGVGRRMGRLTTCPASGSSLCPWTQTHVGVSSRITHSHVHLFCPHPPPGCAYLAAWGQELGLRGVARPPSPERCPPPLFFGFFRAAPVAYGGSQARGPMGAAAAGLQQATATAMQDPRYICDLHHLSQQRQILNPLSKARDQTPHPHGY